MPRKRSFIGVVALHATRRECGEVVLRHERYRGFFAKPHLHAECQITIPLSGRLAMVVGKERYLIGPESVIFLPAEVVHEVSLMDGELDYLLVTHPPQWLGQLIRSMNGRNVALDCPRVVMEPFLWPLARQMAMEIDCPGAGTDLWLEGALAQLGVSMARTIAAKSPAVSSADPRILRAIDTILRSYTDDLCLVSLAREALLSSRHFERLFKQTIGVSPQAFLIQTRLTSARNLIESTDNSIAAIGFAVGFHHSSHFIGSFKRHFGESPGAMRERLAGHPP